MGSHNYCALPEQLQYDSARLAGCGNKRYSSCVNKLSIFVQKIETSQGLF